MRQSRSFASANVDFATAPHNPMPYNFEGSRAQAGFNVAQAFAIRHLRERHGAELFSAMQAPHANVSAILHHNAI